jgi:hypothetical protein
MTDPKSVEIRMRDHVLSHESPVQKSLLEKGEFPPGWVETYLELLKEAALAWRNQTCLPRELVAAVHFASWYLDLRYKTWCKFSASRNINTESQLARIRTPSETFLIMSVIMDLMPSPDPSTQQALDSLLGL